MRKMKMTISAMACLLLSLGIGIGKAQNSSSVRKLSALEQSLISNEKSLLAAKQKDDGAFFKRTVARDFALVGIDGQLLQGQDAIDNLGDSDLAELTPYNLKVMTAGDDTAIVTYDAIVREKPKEDEGPPPRYQHFSSVWVKQDGAWKLKFHQTTAAHFGDW